MSTIPKLGQPNPQDYAANQTSAPKPGDQTANFAEELDIISATNAPLIKKREQFAKQQALAEERIREVGMAQYTREQQEVKKLMKILRMLKEESKGELKETLQSAIEHFENNPAKNVEEVYSYFESIIASLPKGQLRDQLGELLKQIQEIMKSSDQNLSEKTKSAMVKVLG